MASSYLQSHRFESFSQRIAKLNINPISKTRRVDIEQDDTQSSTSYFKNGLEHWGELNLSENYRNFSSEVEPLSESLALILFHSDEIFNILAKYIEKKDALSLEPLFSLFSDFAHDLSERFEPYFERALHLVSNVAVSHRDVEVIEWGFTTIAWLFKYLSRLLYPDLRSTYNVLAPLLGRQPQKQYVSRFAAEAMSYLVRKAAAQDVNFLEVIIKHSFQDLEALYQETEDTQSYEYGISALFSTAITGVKEGYHSSGPLIYRSLLDTSQSNPSDSVLRRITINLFIHGNSQTSSSITKVLSDFASNFGTRDGPFRSQTLAECLYVAAATRKASKIGDWEPMIRALEHLISSLPYLVKETEERTVRSVLKASAVILSHAPMELARKPVEELLEAFIFPAMSRQFLQFCAFYSELSHSRFLDLVFAHFCKFVISEWKTQEVLVLHSFPRLLSGKESVNFKQSVQFQVPDAWTASVVTRLQRPELYDEDVVRLHSFLTMTSYGQLGAAEDLMRALIGKLERKPRISTDASTVLSWQSLMIYGNGLATVLNGKNPSSGLSDIDWTALLNTDRELRRMPKFVGNLLQYAWISGFDMPSSLSESLCIDLTQNLGSPVKNLRVASLRFLDAYYRHTNGQESDAFRLALLIESLPIDVNSYRSISMQIRRLGEIFPLLAEGSLPRKVIPHYCFGLLSLNLSQAWKDALDVLKIVCKAAKPDQEAVINAIFERLQSNGLETGSEISSSKDSEKPSDGTVDVNVDRLDSLFGSVYIDEESAMENLKQNFLKEHRVASNGGSNSITIALRVLVAMPELAEKRSRFFVPYFLEKLGRARTSGPAANEVSLESGGVTKHDRKQLLEISAGFMNPRVLFKADDVYAAALGTIELGDSTLQKSALKTILAWKKTELKQNEEMLFNLLDEKRFRDELSAVPDRLGELSIESRLILMPVLLRLLYGRAVSKEGGYKNFSQSTRRKSIMESLAILDDEEIRMFLSFALSPIQREGEMDDSSEKRRLGCLNIVKDAVEAMGDRLAFMIPGLVPAVLHCMSFPPATEAPPSEAVGYGGDPASLRKALRQSGLQALLKIYSSMDHALLESLMSQVFQVAVEPRLKTLSLETTESVSALLQLCGQWALSWQGSDFFTRQDFGLLEGLCEIVSSRSVKDAVKLFTVGRILLPLYQLVAKPDDLLNRGSTEHRRDLLLKGIDRVLDCSQANLNGATSKSLLDSTIELVMLTSQLASSSSQARQMLKITTELLGQPPNRVSPKSKSSLLATLGKFIPAAIDSNQDELLGEVLSRVSALFGYFKDTQNRKLLADVLSVLKEKDETVLKVAEICSDLNSYNLSTIEEPDFDRRLKAFDLLTDVDAMTFSAKEWEPLLYNMLYFIHDEQELAIRTNASLALRHYVGLFSGPSSDERFHLLEKIILPALRKGVHEKSELIRAEHLSVLATIVKRNLHWDRVNDMIPLLMNDDEEASFFSNILHVQNHRRTRALRRLANFARENKLGSRNASQFLLPLVEHFVFFEAEDANGRLLADEAISTISSLAYALEWPQLRSLFLRNVGHISSKPGFEKVFTRLQGAIIDSLTATASLKYRDEALTQLGSEDIHFTTDDSDCLSKSPLYTSMPQYEKLVSDIKLNILPTLIKHIKQKDEDVAQKTIAVAPSAAKLMRLLPTHEFTVLFPPLLSDTCILLKSRELDHRESSRTALVEISKLVGPSYFGFVLKELRATLLRGTQLHVLSYTIHSILVALVPVTASGDLDYCVADVLSIVISDVFGSTSEEKDASDYTGKMKEVKANKSYDSLELLAEKVSVSSFGRLVTPIRDLLSGRVSMKDSKKLDEVLRRLSVGLLRSGEIGSQAGLVFCYEILQSTLFPDQIPNQHGNRSLRNGQSGKTPKLSKFALDLLRTILQKHDSLKTASKISGFMPIIEEASVGEDEEVQTAALRLLAVILKVPIKDLSAKLPIYAAECVKLIKNSVSVNTELSQAALKLMSSILRDSPDVELKDGDIAYLVKRLRPDFQEQDRQGATFNFLKAVINRKIVINEIYDIMDHLASVMVTSQTRATRDMARGVYVQFILNYPQGPKRFAKQLKFLSGNLEYKFVDGRQSVLETIYLVLSRVPDAILQDSTSKFLVPLVMMTVNDESPECRKMAMALLQSMYKQSSVDQLKNALSLFKKWASQDGNPLLLRTALQQISLVGEENAESLIGDMNWIFERIETLLNQSLEPEEGQWESLFSALQLCLSMAENFPKETFSSGREKLWSRVCSCLYFPHSWVKLSAAKCVARYIEEFTQDFPEDGYSSYPVPSPNGLKLHKKQILEITSFSLRSLKAPSVSKSLADQQIRNLASLAKLVSGMPTVIDEDSKSDSGNEDVAAEGEDRQDPLALIFRGLRRILRQEIAVAEARALVSKQAAAELCAELCTTLSQAAISRSADVIMDPLLYLTDPATTVPFSPDKEFSEAYRSLMASAQDILGLIEKKMGSSGYAKQYLSIREGFKRRREGRRQKRRIELVTDPEKAIKEKRRRDAKKKERRREKGQAFAKKRKAF